MLDILLDQKPYYYTLIFYFQFVLVFISVHVRDNDLVTFLQATIHFYLFDITVSQLLFVFQQLVSVYD